MEDKKKDIRELSILYFEGRIAKADENLLFDYLQQSSDNKAQFSLWEKEWLASDNVSVYTAHEWKRFQCRIRTQEAIIPMLTPSKRKLWKKVAAVAAIIIITSGGTLGTWKTISFLQPDTFFAFESPYGEKSKMILSDGTVVWLNAGSTLKYSDKFNFGNRRVELIGEAYFEVTKKNGTSFVVQTHGYDVVVKGTRFNISAYPDDLFITTTLLEGAVEILYEKKPILLSQGESIRLELTSNKFTRSHINIYQSNAWFENRIEYDDITLKELIAKLSRQYDVNIHLKSNQTAEKRFRISLRNRETIGEVMTALQEIIPITVERKDKDIYISE